MANMLYDFAERPQSARSHSVNHNSRSKHSDNNLFDVWTLTKQDVRYYNEPRSPGVDPSTLSISSPRSTCREAHMRSSSERPYPRSPASTNRVWEPVLSSSRRSSGAPSTPRSPAVLSPQVASNSLSSMKQLFYSESISGESPTANRKPIPMLGDSEKPQELPKMVSRSLEPGKRLTTSELPQGRHLGRNTVQNYSVLYNESAAGTTLPGARLPPSPVPHLPVHMGHGLCTDGLVGRPPVDVKATTRYYASADAPGQRASSRDPSTLPASHQHGGKTTLAGTEPKPGTPQDWGKIGGTGTPSQGSREVCRYEVDPHTPGSPGLKPGYNFINRYQDNTNGTMLPGCGSATPTWKTGQDTPCAGTRAPPSTPLQGQAAGSPSKWGASMATREAMRFHDTAGVSPTSLYSPRKVVHSPRPGQPRSYVQRRSEAEASLLWRVSALAEMTSPAAGGTGGYTGAPPAGQFGMSPRASSRPPPDGQISVPSSPSVSAANKEACRFGNGVPTRGASAAQRPRDRSVSATPPASPAARSKIFVTPKITGEVS